MSETLSQDPDGLNVAYTTYPPTPATPSSTVQDAPPGANLPPFSTFSADMDASGTFTSVSDRLFSDTRLLDISNWDCYGETRLLERTENGLSIISSQPQYRPWESKTVDATSAFAATTPVNSFADAFAQQNGVSKLPSFQSQFQTFNEPVTTTEPTLTTLTNLTPISPNSSSPGSHSLTTLNSNFHTLSAVNPRSYPLVPAPIQAREIPSIQQQFLDERHIQLYSHPTANLTTLNNTIHPASIFPAQNGAIIQNNQLISSPTMVTVIKSEPDIKLTNLPTNVGLHPTQFQNPMTNLSDNGLYNGLDKKMNGISANMSSPTRNDFRKKERRKIRASSLESSAESDGASSNMEIGSENSGQVAAVSSTAGFKTHHLNSNSVDMDDISGNPVDKQVKKKRKRCGECIGCQRKDNCGDCAPCRNDKSHQICKQRRCEKLTEKKNLYGEGSYLRGESRRGRGKGRGGGSYRGRKPSGPVAPLVNASLSTDSNGVPSNQPPTRPSPQPQPVQQPMPVQQQAMAPMPFYADPNRFPAPVWQATPEQAWAPQGQFIQQIPAGQTIETYQQYPNGIYQTTYQQPAFESNTFYTGAVQVLTNRPPSVPNQQAQLTPRPNSNYSHTPSPVPTQNQPQTQQQPQQQQPQQQNQQPAQQQQQQNQTNRQYQEYAIQNQNFNPASTPTGNAENQSRPSSVNSIANPPTPNPNFNQQQQQQNTTVYTSVPAANFSPSSNGASYVSGSSGNEKPGYPQVNSSPQLTSHNSSGYSGQGQYSGQSHDTHWQTQEQQNQILWEQHHENGKLEQGYHQEQMQQGNEHYIHQDVNNSPTKLEQVHKPFSQADKVNLNTRIKTMILNKQQEAKIEEPKPVDQNTTGHFLWYSHHHHLDPIVSGDGGTSYTNNDPSQPDYGRLPEAKNVNNQNFRLGTTSHNSHSKFGNKETQNEIYSDFKPQQYYQAKLKNTMQNEKKEKFKEEQAKIGNEIPQCNCLSPDEISTEPGTYYTHLGCANNLKNLRHDLEIRTGVNGQAIRIEKVRYTGKEGKSAQGCPIAKWVIRRSNTQEQYLIIVKHRKGHFCPSAFIVICIVVWEGLQQNSANELYSMLTDKLNKFGLPTKRRCGTNLQKTCNCQGFNQETCGASFSFGCSWSMYYNGCKFARSKDARKFRLVEKLEEKSLENRLQALADFISPMYRNLAPKSFENQCRFENVASDCRLGSITGRPFSGVTACMDFCAHSHKDLQNMNNGCTVVVSLTKHRDFSKPVDEQLHVLPLYVADDTDENGSKDSQNQKMQQGSIEVLTRFHSEVRTGNAPAKSCNKKRSKKQAVAKISNTKSTSSEPKSPSMNFSPQLTSSPIDKSSNNSKEIQNNHISSTIFGRYDYCSNVQNVKAFSNEFNPYYPSYPYSNYSNHYQYGFLGDYVYSSNVSNPMWYGNSTNNPFDDSYSNNTPPKVDSTTKSEEFTQSTTDNLECFKDPEIGGVAIALTHGSVLFECAKYEVHATTALKNPNRQSPTRISLVFYQHRNLNRSCHGLLEYTQKRELNKSECDSKLDSSLSSLSNSDDFLLRAPTVPTVSLTTMFPMYPCMVTGPYQENVP